MLSHATCPARMALALRSARDVMAVTSVAADIRQHSTDPLVADGRGVSAGEYGQGEGRRAGLKGRQPMADRASMAER
ncbi:hypothetical protein D9M68_971100 [compost metagenome]